MSEAEKRAKNVLPAFCGFYGACGAAIGVGIFMSIYTGTTPLTKDTWKLCNMSTADALKEMAKIGGPYKAARLCGVKLKIPGEHNILNALAAIACCRTLGVDVSTIVETLEEYSGTERRFDILGKTNNNIKIIDDYAHHPTEIKATIEVIEIGRASCRERV